MIRISSNLEVFGNKGSDDYLIAHYFYSKVYNTLLIVSLFHVLYFVIYSTASKNILNDLISNSSKLFS